MAVHTNPSLCSSHAILELGMAVPAAWLSFPQASQKLQPHLPNRQRIKQQMPSKVVGLGPFLSSNSMIQEVPGGRSLPRGPGMGLKLLGWPSPCSTAVPREMSTSGPLGCGIEDTERFTYPSSPRFLPVVPSKWDKSLPSSEIKALTWPSLSLLLIWSKTGVAMGVFQARIWLKYFITGW